MRDRNITLRWIALIGLAVVMVVDMIASLQMKSGWGLGFAMCLLFPVAVGGASFLLMPRALGTLACCPDLLVPVALLAVASKALDWLTSLPLLGALLVSSQPLKIINTGFSISLHLIFSIGIAVFYASWVTGAVIECVQTGRSDLGAEVSPALRRLGRVLGAEVIGMGTVLLMVTILILLMPMVGFLVLVPMALFAVGWNFFTAALLPVVCQSSVGFWLSLKQGIIVSIANFRRWWLLLFVQMLLLGLVCIYFSIRAGNTNFSWSINAFWTGDYEADCRWYPKLAQAAGVARLPVVNTLLTLVFGAMAVAVKLAIVQRYSAKADVD